ncbi:MAG: glycoside hydrolase family 32 protein [Lachnobacterium sp.]|nr:glycoside hydrolase family 32 protein [Lachnobacterium sp.]
MSEMLEKARNYEAGKLAGTDPATRPLFHIAAPAGWINDPNGFSVYDGRIHLFYQYNPYDREWGPMHWGHSVSTDMIHWEQLPAALAPDQEYDKIGCFSGSAIEADGKHILVYTGVTKVKMEDQSEQERQNQCIAFGDGKDYVKYEKNPVVTGDMLPENCSRIDFRDPKIWKENDTYYLIVGSKDNQQIGQVVLCSSKDLKEWKIETILASNEIGKIGTMWECPDFFPLGDKRVLICSPQNMKAEKYEFHNGHNSVYFVGDYDSETHRFVKKEPHPLDYGMDFYAPQTTELPDGRRIMIAWMKSWDACVIPDSQDWQGMMTLPRELELKDGRIWQKPVREIETYHKNFCKYEKAEIAGETTLAGVEGRTIDLTVTLENGDFTTFSMKLAANDEYETNFTYHKECGMLEIDRTYCGVTKDIVCVRKIKISDPDGLKTMRFILDRQSIELFINDGQQVATTAICTPQEAKGISFFSDRKMWINVEKYDIVKPA